MDAADPGEERTRSLAWSATAGQAPRLLVFWEGGFAARPLVEGATLVIGRSQDCDVHVIHPSFSRKHVAVHVGPPLMVEDLGSSHGTRIDGRQLRPLERARMEPGSVVEAGSAIILVHAPATGVPVLAVPPPTAAPASPMERVRRLLDLVAASGLSVLLQGETGVGKDFAATIVHERSPRARGPFVRLNCAALPEGLLESELFGHERGAFTGAVGSKAGLLETAHGGTVLLDEVAELSLVTQAKLLRVLETQEVLRLGGLHPRRIDTRLVTATNRDLSAVVQSGAFRQDLYYRINGMTIRVPPLRERIDEIEPLARRFMEQACARSSRLPLAIEAHVLQLLRTHAWPGNIRELRNVIERAVVLSQGATLEPSAIVFDEEAPGTPVGHGASPDLRQDVDAYERVRLVEALERAQGNQTKAAGLLGISRRALIGRMITHGLPRPKDGRQT